MDGKRPRCDKLEELAVLVKGYIHSPTRIRYGEDLAKSKTEARVLVSHAILLRGLEQLQPNTSFKKLDLMHVLLEVADFHNERWRLSAADQKSFASKVAARIRTMCAHYSAARRKKTPPKWVLQIAAKEPNQQTIPVALQPNAGGTSGGIKDDTVLDDSDSGGGDEDIDGSELEHDEVKPDSGDSGEEVGSPVDGKEDDSAFDDYFVGWDGEKKKAWRCRSENPAEIKDFADHISCPDELTDFDCVTAYWSDGWHKKLALTAGQYRTIRDRKKHHGEALVIEDTGYVCKPSKHKGEKLYFLMRASDRHQVCQVFVKVCPSEDAAVETMRKVARRLAAGATDAYAERNTILAQLAMSKKPAASCSAVAAQPVQPRAVMPAACDPASQASSSFAKPHVTQPLTRSPATPRTPPSKRKRGSMTDSPEQLNKFMMMNMNSDFDSDPFA